MPRCVCRRAECDDSFYLLTNQERIEPAVAIRNQLRIIGCCGLYASIHAVEKRVDDDITRGDSKLGEKALKTPACFPYEHTANNRLVLGRILPDHENASGTIEAATMKNWPPFYAKLIWRVDIRFRIIHAQTCEMALKNSQDQTGEAWGRLLLI